SAFAAAAESGLLLRLFRLVLADADASHLAAVAAPRPNEQILQARGEGLTQSAQIARQCLRMPPRRLIVRKLEALVSGRDLLLAQGDGPGTSYCFVVIITGNAGHRSRLPDHRPADALELFRRTALGRWRGAHHAPLLFRFDRRPDAARSQGRVASGPASGARIRADLRARDHGNQA